MFRVYAGGCQRDGVLTDVLSGGFTAGFPDPYGLAGIFGQVPCKVTAHEGAYGLFGLPVNVGNKGISYNNFSLKSYWISFDFQYTPPNSLVEFYQGAREIVVVKRHDALEIFCCMDPALKP